MIGREYDAIEAVLVECLFIFMACVFFFTYNTLHWYYCIHVSNIDEEVPRYTYYMRYTEKKTGKYSPVDRRVRATVQ